MEFPCQGPDPSHSCNLSHSCNNAGSLTHCQVGIKPASQSAPKMLPILLHYSENSSPGFCLVSSFGTCSSATSFCLTCCISVYLVGWIHFPTLEKCSSVGGVLCFPAVHSPLVIQAMGWGYPKRAAWVFLSRRVLWMVWFVAKLCLVRRLLAAGWQGLVRKQLTADSQEAPGLVQARRWWSQSQEDHEAVDHPRWWVKPGPGVSAGLLEGRVPGPGVWLQGPGIPKLVSDHWWEQPVPDSWEWYPRYLEAGSGRCGRDWSAGCRTVAFLCPESGPWGRGEAGLEASTGFLAKGCSDCPRMGGTGSWPPGGMGRV